MSDTLTDEHHDWVARIFGVDPRSYAAPDSASRDASASTPGSPPAASAPGSPSDQPSAGNALAAPGSAPDAPGSGDDDAEAPSRFMKFVKDAGAFAAGVGAHVIAGAVPGGVVGATAIDAEVAAKGNSEQRFWYGLGAVAGGVVDGVAAIGEMGGGVLAAIPSGGLSLAVTAEGVNEAIAATEAVGAGVALMASGAPNGGGGGGGGRRPNKNAGKAVKDILKDKKGSIRNAPLEPGSPSWEDVQNMTWEEIEAAAKADKPGYRTIRKLLTDGRFDK